MRPDIPSPRKGWNSLAPAEMELIVNELRVESFFKDPMERLNGGVTLLGCEIRTGKMPVSLPSRSFRDGRFAFFIAHI